MATEALFSPESVIRDTSMLGIFALGVIHMLLQWVSEREGKAHKKCQFKGEDLCQFPDHTADAVAKIYEDGIRRQEVDKNLADAIGQLSANVNAQTGLLRDVLTHQQGQVRSRRRE